MLLCPRGFFFVRVFYIYLVSLLFLGYIFIPVLSERFIMTVQEIEAKLEEDHVCTSTDDEGGDHEEQLEVTEEQKRVAEAAGLGEQVSFKTIITLVYRVFLGY